MTSSPASGGERLPAAAPIDPAQAFFLQAFEPQHRHNPYPLYAAMAAHAPLHDTGIGLWLAFSHADCWELVRSAKASSDERRGNLFQLTARNDPRVAALMDRQPGLIFLDPPDHTRLRALVSQAFTPSTVAALRPRIEALAEALLDGLAERAAANQAVDLVQEYAYPLPVAVICELLGIPLADHDRFRAWSAALARSVDPAILRTPDINAAIDEAKAELATYTAELAAERRRAPRGDLLSGLLAAQDGDDRLRHQELIDLVGLLLVAGHETTVNLIGNGLLALLRHPDQLGALRADPGLDRTAVEELLRYDSPVQMVQRVATEPLRLGDVEVPAGGQVVPILAAANRDPAVFDEPDRLDLRRPSATRHLAFGGGIHHCLGAALARTEGEIAIGRLIRRFPSLELAGEPVLRPTFTLRGYEHLPANLGRASER